MKISKDKLSEKQQKKLRLAAEMIKTTYELFDGDKSMLPHWGAGVITHGQPKTKQFEIGITIAAEKAAKKDQTKDHLFRVTETAKFLLNKAQHMSVEQIEDVLFNRSLTMRTTKTENNSTLKEALKRCANKDDWKELYKNAGISYRLYSNDECN